MEEDEQIESKQVKPDLGISDYSERVSIILNGKESPIDRSKASAVRKIKPTRALQIQYGAIKLPPGKPIKASRKAYSNNKSGYKGVYFLTKTKRYRVYLYIHGKAFHIGHFKDKIEAAKAYDIAAKRFRGDKAILNFP